MTSLTEALTQHALRQQKASPGPNDVVFTQFLLPHGRRQRVWVERAPEVAARARALAARGCRLEIETLLSGEVSMTVEREVGGEDDVVSIRVCENGPAVLEAVDELVEEAHGRVVGGGT